MSLQLLEDTPVVSVYYDAQNDWLFVDWRGDLTLPLVQAGCLTVAQCFMQRPQSRVLNSNCDVTSMSEDVAAWLGQYFLPHIGLAGVEYLAWVCAPNPEVEHLVSQAVQHVNTPVVTVFSNLADGYAWLHDVHFPYPDTPAKQSVVERQAELVSRLTVLAQELAAYEQVRPGT